VLAEIDEMSSPLSAVFVVGAALSSFIAVVVTASMHSGD
jgi:hypothetical protein